MSLKILRSVPVSGRRRARGISLVELMVGIAVGLFVVAAATVLVSGQLSDNRKLLLETQVQQDIRSVAEVMARDLRRAGFEYVDPNAKDLTPAPTIFQAAAPASLGLIGKPAWNTIDLAASQVFFEYRRNRVITSHGFSLLPAGAGNAAVGVVQSCEAQGKATKCDGLWQDLTDTNTVDVKTFRLSDVRDEAARKKSKNFEPLTLPCPNICNNGTTDCWPKVAVRQVIFHIAAESSSSASVKRQFASGVTIRTPLITLTQDPAVPAGLFCPVSQS